MKELWTANPFHLMNRPFAEMGYNSSGLNIVPRAPSVGNSPTLHAPSDCFRRTILRPSARHPPTRHKPSATHGTTSGDPRKPSAVVLRSTWRSPAQHPPSRRKPSAISLRAIRRPPRVIRWHPAGNLLARTDALNDPQNKPSAQAGALNPRKSTFCVIVNCPLQIKPVFYFLFTSIASPAHRIRVKSSLLRLGRSCLALPFTHLGKDIT